MAMAFGLIYGLSCLTKLSSNFWVLLFGRFTGGVATSLLFCVFEAWMVNEHHRLGFDQNSLNSIFSKSVTLNGLVAILAGLAASLSAAIFGFVAPFMLSFILLMFLTAVVHLHWTENYGNTELEVAQNLKSAFQAIKSNFSILLLGLVQSLFEGAMYVFVFMWTPTLSEATEEFSKPNTYMHGLVFSSFMLAVMLGSSIYSKLSEKTSPTQIMSILLLVAAAALTVPIFFTTNATLSLLSFLIFECCCGLYFPTAASLRSLVIPEDSRTTIMSMFRMGLNLLVIIALKSTGTLETSTTFTICVIWLLVAAAIMRLFPNLSSKETPEQLSA
jgi:MFS family permease